MTTVPQNIDSAYMACADIVKQHYENFPVASVLLPKYLRKPISAIYSFARTADDLADEGDFKPSERLIRLEQYARFFENILAGEKTDDPVFFALTDTIRRFDLNPTLFTDLISAFKQDITKTRYQNFEEVLDYCNRSANPVGRLLLQLVKKDQPQARQFSDAVCTALQLINFYQDIAQDYDENNRIYLAENEMATAGINEEYISQRINDEEFNNFINQQIHRADNMLISGYPLCHHIGGRLGMELKITIHAAHAVVNKMLLAKDCFTRPRLSKTDWPVILFMSLFDIAPKVMSGLKK